MDPAIITTLLTLIGGALGWLGKALMDAIRQYKSGHKAELQQRDEQIEEIRAQKLSWKRQAGDWESEYRYLRAWILAQNLDSEQLGNMPRVPPQYE